VSRIDDNENMSGNQKLQEMPHYAICIQGDALYATYQKGVCKENGTAFYANHVEEVAGKTETMNVIEYAWKWIT